MGTFEKLGILVIVVIIVMILAVAIYQWGDSATGDLSPACGPGFNPPTLDIDEPDDGGKQGAAPGRDPAPRSTMWNETVPKEHLLVAGENVWELVQRWKLRESFIQEVRRANPGRSFEKLRAGETLRVPDPAGFGVRDPAPKPDRTARPRRYEVQEGDTLGGIALKHLGSTTRWKDIQKLNPGITPRNMRAGITILLPAK